MRFNFSPRTDNPKERRIERFFEMVPGTLSWTIILGMFFLTFYKPFLAAAIIIAFDLYWLLRIFYILIFLMLSYLRLLAEKETDWMKRISNIDLVCKGSPKKDLRVSKFSLAKLISLWIHQKDIELLKREGSPVVASEDIFHLVIIPVIKERREIVEPTLASLAESRFPGQKLIVVIALEERADEEVKKDAEKMRSEFKRRFFDILVFVHPQNIPDEAAVKGANITYAASKAAEFVRDKGIRFENIIVSCFDADTVVSPDYFSCLTYYFLVTPDRLRASFQPIPVYHNNIWEVPAFARVLDVGSSFFQLVESTNPSKLVTFSSHSMSFKALVDVGFWPVDMISDDSAIFWKAFIHYDGNYHVVPIYITVSMDIAQGDSWLRTLVNVYRQKRRWAWGVENYPIVMRAFLKDRVIPFSKKFRYIFKLLESHVSWASWPFILGIISWLPIFLTSREFSNSVLYYSTPRINAIIFNLASLGLVATTALSLMLLPKKRLKHPFLKRIGHILEWLLVPLISVFLSAIPALDAQTRLMRARYMEFWVTEKKR